MSHQSASSTLAFRQDLSKPKFGRDGLKKLLRQARFEPNLSPSSREVIGMRAAPFVLSCTLMVLLLPLPDTFAGDTSDAFKPTFESQFQGNDKTLPGFQGTP